MSNKIVFDASAIIALLELEEGWTIASENLNNAIVSTINLSEVMTVMNRKTNGQDVAGEAFKLLQNTFPHIVDFNEEQAVIAASLDSVTKQYGLSLGDRACLALAKHKNLPVLTADKAWKQIESGVEVRLIR